MCERSKVDAAPPARLAVALPAALLVASVSTIHAAPQLRLQPILLRPWARLAISDAESCRSADAFTSGVSMIITYISVTRSHQSIRFIVFLLSRSR